METTSRLCRALALTLAPLFLVPGCADRPEVFDPESVREVDVRSPLKAATLPARRYTLTRESQISLETADPTRHPFPGTEFARFSGAFFARGGELVGAEHRLVVDVDSFPPDTAEPVVTLIRSPEGLAADQFPNLTIFFESAESRSAAGDGDGKLLLTGFADVRGIRVPFRCPATLSFEDNRLRLFGRLDLSLARPEFENAPLLRQQFGEHLRLVIFLHGMTDGKTVPVAARPSESPGDRSSTEKPPPPPQTPAEPRIIPGLPPRETGPVPAEPGRRTTPVPGPKKTGSDKP